MESSLSALAFSLLPLALAQFVTSERFLWSIASGIFALYLVGVVTYYLHRWSRLIPSMAGGWRFSGAMVAGSALAVVGLLINTIGWPVHQSFGPYLAALLLQVSIAGTCLFRTVLLPQGQ